jgi:3-methyladenine DNA glycosylase AlkD
MDVAAQIAAEIAALPKRDTPSIRIVRRRWSQALKTIPTAEVRAAAQTLEARAGQGGKWVAYELIRHHAGAFAAFGEADARDHAARVQSWYAVDALGTILVGPAWARGQLPNTLIEDWSKSGDRWLRRSALVAVVGLNARASGGPGDAARTLPICDRLAADRDDMVEKALSWALRALSVRDRPAVERFMAEHEAVLAARVKREVRNKLATGLKSGRLRQS